MQVASVFGLGSLTDDEVSGHYAYVFSNGVIGGYLGVIDVSVPSEPVVLLLLGHCLRQWRRGEIVTCTPPLCPRELHVVDVSEPIRPVSGRSRRLARRSWDVAVSSTTPTSRIPSQVFGDRRERANRPG